MSEQVQPQPMCDDAWNIEHRAEAPLQRADRNFAELLQELRVAQTGVQILFAFLLTLSFMDRFATINAFQRGVYVFTLVASATTVALLVAPVAVVPRRQPSPLLTASSRTSSTDPGR